MPACSLLMSSGSATPAMTCVRVRVRVGVGVEVRVGVRVGVRVRVRVGVSLRPCGCRAPKGGYRVGVRVGVRVRVRVSTRYLVPALRTWLGLGLG